MSARIGRSLDITRLSAALARPGIDTRIQSSLAYADDESFVDAEHGVFLDVTLVPSGQQITCRVPADYSGAGWGRYAQIHKDDELLVVIPNGNPRDGGVVVSRLYSAADTPPQDAINNPDEVVVSVEPKHPFRLRTRADGGKIEVDAEDDITTITTKHYSVFADQDIYIHTDATTIHDSEQSITHRTRASYDVIAKDYFRVDTETQATIDSQEAMLLTTRSTFDVIADDTVKIHSMGPTTIISDSTAMIQAQEPLSLISLTSLALNAPSMQISATGTGGISFSSEGGSPIALNSSKVRIGSAGAGEALILGNTYRTAEDKLFAAIQTAIASITAMSGGGPAAALIGAAIEEFKAGIYLSDKAMTE